MSSMATIALLVVSAMMALTVILPRRAQRLRIAHEHWRKVVERSVPVWAAPSGAYRDAGTIALGYSSAPRMVRNAAELADAGAVCFALNACLFASFVSGRMTRTSEVDYLHWPAPVGVPMAVALVLFTLAPLAIAFLVQRAGAALLKRQRSAPQLALASVVATVVWLIVSAGLTLDYCLPAGELEQPLLACYAGAGVVLLVAAFVVLLFVVRYRKALDAAEVLV
jgi:hypothetical protein